MKTIVSQYANAGGFTRDIVQMLFALVVFYAGALLPDRIISFLQVGEYHKILVEITFVVVLAFIFVVVRGFFRRAYEKLQEMETRQRKSLEIASAAMQRIVAERIRETRMPINESSNSVHNGVASMECLRDIVKNLYSHLESEFGESELLHGRIEFEVTFMTRSYVDDKITIPAFANRFGRAPVSMRFRSDNVGIYDNTVTAEMFRSDRPGMRIVEDTSQPSEEYRELYAGQLQRIKSSIVYPVLDDRNELLGTLVVHCNKRNFFRCGERIFWGELLERYAVQLAFEKSRFDLLENVDLLADRYTGYPKPF